MEIRKRRIAVKSGPIVTVSGTRYKDIADQIKEDGASGGGPYVAYFLVGGRGGDNESGEFVEAYSKRTAQVWRDEFSRTPAGEEAGVGFGDYSSRAGRRRWAEGKCGPWRPRGNHRRRAEKEWGAWGQNGNHLRRTEEEFRSWGMNGRTVVGSMNGDHWGETGAIYFRPKKNGGRGTSPEAVVVGPKRSGAPGTIAEAIRDRPNQKAAPGAVGEAIAAGPKKKCASWDGSNCQSSRA